MTANKPFHPVLSFARKSFSIFMVLAFLTAALPFSANPARAQAAVTCVKQYTVVSGDTISKIAFENNVTVEELAAANNMNDPYPIFIGQSLCIPAASGTTTTGTTTTTSGTTTTTTSSTDPDYTIALSGKVLTIDASHFPTKTTFYVRVGQGRFKIQKWYKLGRVRTDKTGETGGDFVLPKELRKASLLTVCVKNVSTDDVLCKRYTTGIK
jgi:spore germination protein YaaH